MYKALQLERVTSHHKQDVLWSHYPLAPLLCNVRGLVEEDSHLLVHDGLNHCSCLSQGLPTVPKSVHHELYVSDKRHLGVALKSDQSFCSAFLSPFFFSAGFPPSFPVLPAVISSFSDSSFCSDVSFLFLFYSSCCDSQAASFFSILEDWVGSGATVSRIPRVEAAQDCDMMLC